MNNIQLVIFDLGRVLIRLAADRPDAAAIAGLDLPSLSESAWKDWTVIRDEHETGKIDLDRKSVV